MIRFISSRLTLHNNEENRRNKLKIKFQQKLNLNTAEQSGGIRIEKKHLGTKSAQNSRDMQTTFFWLEQESDKKFVDAFLKKKMTHFVSE
jgi:hypothetical protein